MLGVFPNCSLAHFQLLEATGRLASSCWHLSLSSVLRLQLHTCPFSRVLGVRLMLLIAQQAGISAAS